MFLIRITKLKIISNMHSMVTAMPTNFIETSVSDKNTSYLVYKE